MQLTSRPLRRRSMPRRNPTNQSHHRLPSDALSRLDPAAVTARLRRAVASTFYCGLCLVDMKDPARISVALAEHSGEGSSDDDLVVCRALSRSLNHPMPKSLVHDVLFVRRDGDVGHHAREAISTYQQTATLATVSRHTRVYSAIRAR
jgi:hypothetical protein